MTERATYYSERQAEDAMAVIAGWIGRNRNVQVVYHDGTAVDADIFKGRIRIPRLACASGVTQEALMLLRGRIYHEAGHIDETVIDKADWPKGSLHEIFNALEDRRMEAAEAKKYKGCESVFRWNTEYYNRKIAEKMNSGEQAGPLWESLVAMAFQVDGFRPLWTLSDKAQLYFDRAYDEFSKVRTCEDATDSLELARRIHEILRDAAKEWKEQQQEQEKQEGQKDGDPNQESSSQGKQGKGSSDKQDGEPQQQMPQSDVDDDKPQSGGTGDMEDEDEEGEGEESDEKDGEGKSEGSDEDDSDNEDKGKSGSDGDDSEDDSEGSDEGDSGDSKDGDKESKDGDQDGEGSSGSEGDDSEGDDSEGSSDGDSTDDSKSGSSGGDESDGATSKTPFDENKEGDEGDEGGQSKKDKKDDQMSDAEAEKTLDGESEGMSKEDVQNEELADCFKNMDPRDKKYISRRDNDEHKFPRCSDGDKETFRDRRDLVSAMVASMTRALEQSLRSLARCRRKPYLRQGKIDHKRLVQIAKGLSKDVFYKTRQGIKMDVAVEIVIDESGSMGEYLEVQLLALAIGEALHSIGVPFEILGTTTKNGYGAAPALDGFSRTNPIVYQHYKEFQESWAVIRHRIVHTGCHNHNIDGEAVEYAAFRLMQRKETRKVVFSLSDGEPCGGHGSTNDNELASNLVRVCKRARENGVEVYGFGIGTEEPKRFYGKDWFMFLEDISEMGPDFIKRLVEIITKGAVRL